MGETILITCGAGFIGRHVVRALLHRGHHVRVLDSLVVHLAAEVGVGQSMYQIDRYVSANELGTAVLFQQLISRPVRRVVTASSMSIYGEGLYRDGAGRLREDVERGPRTAGQGWDPVDADDCPLVPLPTPETKRPSLASVYALGKYAQERLTLTAAPPYGMEATCLGLFNVYGPGQALSNPYTGVLAIFAARLANGQPPLIFEDGEQRRDFVHVDDVARGIAHAMGIDLAPEITGQARAGDIRHCFADVTRARDVLGFAAERDWADGLGELAEWVERREAHDHVAEARRELEQRGLVA